MPDVATTECWLHRGLACVKSMAVPLKFQHKISNHQKNCACQQVDFRRILAKSPNPLSKEERSGGTVDWLQKLQTTNLVGPFWLSAASLISLNGIFFLCT